MVIPMRGKLLITVICACLVASCGGATDVPVDVDAPTTSTSSTTTTAPVSQFDLDIEKALAYIPELEAQINEWDRQRQHGTANAALLELDRLHEKCKIWSEILDPILTSTAGWDVQCIAVLMVKVGLSEGSVEAQLLATKLKDDLQAQIEKIEETLAEWPLA